MPANQPAVGAPLALELRAAIAGWEDGPGVPHERLAGALARAIASGELVAGTRLPPERRLAAHLSAGRTLVAAAYRVLETQGLVERRQGRGTRVTGPAARDATALQSNAVLRGLGTRHLHATDLRTGSGPPSRRVLDALERAVAAVPVRRLADSAGYYPHGLPLLRERVAIHLTTLGLPTAAEEILVTSGAQQALGLIAACYVPPGANVVVEDPTFPGIVDALRAVGASILAVRVGADGVDLASLTATIARNDVAAVVLTPTFHVPTGATVPASGRRALGDLAAHRGVLLVDDGTTAELSLGLEPPPPLARFAPPERVLSIGSLSKLVWGGLRIGWIRGPRSMLEQLAAVKGASDLGSSLIGQAVAADLLADAARIRQLRRQELRERLDAVGEALHRSLPDWSWTAPGGGGTLWVRLPAGGATELAHRAEAAGLLVTPGPVVSPTGGFDDHLLLPFDHEPAVLRAAVETLAAANRSLNWRAALP